MGGFLQTEGETALIAGWIDTLPALTSTAPMDAADVAHGQELFEGEAGCIDCHSGAHFTNNLSVDVGTGGALQVPTLLGISMRGPFLHDGDAATLEQTLDHGEDLTGMDREALVAYLSTL
jgi:mono/diheme cytochrome c family protein